MDAPQRPAPVQTAPLQMTAQQREACWAKMTIGILIILIILIIYGMYLLWQSQLIGPAADCNDYPSGPLNYLCEAGVNACKGLSGRDGVACNAAVGACMPVVHAAFDREAAQQEYPLGQGEKLADFFNRVAPHVPDCALASYKVSPKGAAKAFETLPVDLPPWIAPFYKDPETRANVRALAGLVPDAVDWSLDFGENLPTKGSFTPGGAHHCDSYRP